MTSETAWWLLIVLAGGLSGIGAMFASWSLAQAWRTYRVVRVRNAGEEREIVARGHAWVAGGQLTVQVTVMLWAANCLAHGPTTPVQAVALRAVGLLAVLSALTMIGSVGTARRRRQLWNIGSPPRRERE